MWEKATDKNNADRLADVKMVHQEMLGRIMNQIQSYECMDNDKYKRIEKTLQIMKETFGFHIDGMDQDQAKVEGILGAVPSNNMTGYERTPYDNTDKSAQRWFGTAVADAG